MAGANLGTASGRIEIDGSGAAKGFQVAEQAADAFFGAIQDKISSLDQLGHKMQAIGGITAAGFGVAINSAANFEQALDGIQAVSGATEAQMGLVSKAALRIGADTSYSATEAAGAIEEIIKAGVSVEDALNGAADATVALAAAGGISLPEAATIASNALNAFNLKGQDMAHVSDLIAGAANASAIDVGQFGQSLSQSGAVANLAGVSFDDLSVAIAEMGQAGIKGSDAGTSIKTFLTNLIPTTDAQRTAFKRLGLVSVGTGENLAKLAKMGIKPVSNSYDDVSKALAKYVEKSGGADVGTAKNNKEVQRLGSQLGVLKNDFFDASGNAKDFGAIQGELAKATAGMSKEQKLATLELLFGSDALRAAAIFADEGAAGFDKMAGAMSKVTAAQVAATRLSNFRGAVEALKGSLETASITIGSVFLPVVTKIVKAITSVVNVFNNLPPGLQKAIAILVAVGAAVVALAGTLLTLIVPIGLLIAKFAGLAAVKSIFSIFTKGFGALRAGAGIFEAVGASVARGAAVFARFGGIARIVLSVLARIPAAFLLLRGLAGIVFGPWGLAISLAIQALVLLYQHFAPFRNLVNSVGKAIQSGFLAALSAAKSGIAQLVSGFKNGITGGSGFATFMQTLGAGAQILWTALQQLGHAFMTQLLPALKAAGAALKGGLLTAWHTMASAVSGSLMPALRQLGSALAPLLPYLAKLGVFLLKSAAVASLVGAALVGAVLFGLIKLATLIVGTVLPAIIKFVAWLAGGLISALAAVAGVVIKVVSAIVGFVAGLIDGMTGAADATSSGASAIGAALRGIAGFFVTAFNAAKDAVVTALTATWSFITSTISGIGNGIQTGLSAVGGFFTAAWNGIKSVAVTVFTAIKTAISVALGAIVTVVTTYLSTLLGIWSAIWNSSFGQLVQNALGLIVDIVKLAMALIILAVSSVLAGLIAIWNTAWTAISTAAVAIWTALATAATVAWTAIKTAILTAVAGIAAAVTTAWTAVSTAVTTALAAIRAVVSAAWSAIRSGASAAWSAVAGAISSAWSRITSIVSSAAAAVRAVAVAAWNAIRSATAPAWNAIASVISSVMARIKGVVSSVSNAVRSAITAAWNAAKSATVSIWNALVAAVSSAIGKVMAKVRAIKGQVVGAFAGAAGWLLSAGSAIVQGLINGISSRISAARAKVQELASIARNAAAKVLKIGSPSKVFRDIGRFVGDGFVEGLTGSAAKVRAASQKMANLVQRAFDQKGVKGTGKGTLKRIDKAEKQLLAIAKKREVVATKIKDATKKLNDALKLRDDYAKQVQQAFTAVGNVTKFETNGRTSAPAIIKGMQDALAKAKAFAAYVQKLKKQGLNNQSLQDILAAGPDAGYETARALSDGGKAAVNQVNGLQAQLTSAGKGLGDSMAAKFYGAGVNAARGLLKGLKSQDKALEAAAKRIADSLSKAIRRALKIHSPSQVMAGLGSFSVEGFVKGIQSQYRALEDAMAGVTMRATDITPNVAGMKPARNTSAGQTPPVRSGPVVNQHVVINNPERVRDSKDRDRALQLAGAFV